MADVLKGLPTKVRVGQFTLKFQVVNETDHPDIKGSNGLTDFDNSVIYLHETFIGKNDAERTLNVVQHEVSHAINLVYGVSDESTEEQFVERNTNGLISFWIDNPKYEAWRRRLLNEIRKGHAE